MLCFGTFLVAKKFVDKKGEYHSFPSKTFCLTLLKIFEREPSSLSLVSGIEKNIASEGFVTIFRRKLFISQYRNIS